MDALPPVRRRAVVIVLDGAGVGALPDAAAYGDEGSNTLGNLAIRVPLEVPTLRALGLDRIVSLGSPVSRTRPLGAVGRMAEISAGKDSVTGHWELMGVVSPRPFPVFPDGFPAEVITAFERAIGRRTLGNVAASGTGIIAERGEEHVRTGWPIVYTSADSVFQIAAHETVVPVDELYRWCERAYEVVVDGLGVARVIARPFVGRPGAFTRTARRRDFTCPPRGVTLLDRLKSAGRPVVGIGKIEDLFSGRGLTRAIHTESDADGMRQLMTAMSDTPTGLLFANLVDFDTVYGHRNDAVGYARNLDAFDRRLAALLPQMTAEDVLVITADHGNDPTTVSTDHSREYVPLLVYGEGVAGGALLGTRRTFADVGQTLAEALTVERLAHGTSFLDALGTAGESPSGVGA